MADDLAQETFLKAYRNLDRFRADAKLSTWLYRIAYNTYLAQARKKSGKELPLPEREEGEAPSGTTLARHDLNRAFQELRTEERAALSLTYGRDLSHEEAAEILDMPVGTLKTHVRRGKERLRTRLKAWQNEVVA